MQSTISFINKQLVRASNALPAADTSYHRCSTVTKTTIKSTTFKNYSCKSYSQINHSHINDGHKSTMVKSSTATKLWSQNPQWLVPFSRKWWCHSVCRVCETFHSVSCDFKVDCWSVAATWSCSCRFPTWSWSFDNGLVEERSDGVKLPQGRRFSVWTQTACKQQQTNIRKCFISGETDVLLETSVFTWFCQHWWKNLKPVT